MAKACKFHVLLLTCCQIGANQHSSPTIAPQISNASRAADATSDYLQWEQRYRGALVG